MPHHTAITAKPLSAADRKKLVTAASKKAMGKTLAGMKLIDFREPSAAERAVAERLAEKLRRSTSRCIQ